MASNELPKTTSQYVLKTQKGFESLELEHDVSLPKLGDYDCLVQIQAVSLNYRDLIIAKGQYPFPVKTPVIPCSDAAGNVLAVGPKVTEFEVGDKVCTLFNEKHQAGALTPVAVASGLGGAFDGTLRQYGVFPEHGLVPAPTNLTPTEAGTLSCAPLTAWNALYGLESKALKPGQVVLTQGTGGVSVAAIQFAKAAGAIVIATSSSEEKCKFLKEKLGADITINYKTHQNWGELAKKHSPDGEGVDHVIEIGGPSTMEQSMKAIKMEGVITVIGFVGGPGAEKQPSTLDTLTYTCTVRGILVGSRLQFKAMNRAIDAANIHPVVDKTFEFEKAQEAYQYQWDQRHIGKVVIQLGRLQ
ncbi:hypothetical protein LTS08_000881 [Lithohypha guttulata]|uniref:uncharacterized protein n=1 Tax=Lithohypha guttulata TaxID=1690604 RepID=UPI002DE03A0F|nr:hypothetical protein LTR51_006504 [Lithohypha guttulata]KAK5106759.1 hypothetical protein LTS08_000881 [Lithohypha guttulata]